MQPPARHAISCQARSEKVLSTTPEWRTRQESNRHEHHRTYPNRPFPSRGGCMSISTGQKQKQKQSLRRCTYPIHKQQRAWQGHIALPSARLAGGLRRSSSMLRNRSPPHMRSLLAAGRANERTTGRTEPDSSLANRVQPYREPVFVFTSEGDRYLTIGSPTAMVVVHLRPPSHIAPNPYPTAISSRRPRHQQ